MPLQFFEIVRVLEILMLLRKIFAVGKDKDFQFNRKIIELGPPTLQVPRRPCTDTLLGRQGIYNPTKRQVSGSVWFLTWGVRKR